MLGLQLWVILSEYKREKSYHSRRAIKKKPIISKILQTAKKIIRRNFINKKQRKPEKNWRADNKA